MSLSWCVHEGENKPLLQQSFQFNKRHLLEISFMQRGALFLMSEHFKRHYNINKSWEGMKLFTYLLNKYIRCQPKTGYINKCVPKTVI